MATAMEILEGMDTKQKDRIRSEYEKMAKKSIKLGVNCPDPENWLAQHPEIAPKLYAPINWAPDPDLNRKFKKIMIEECGFGSIMERAIWLAQGR